MTSNVSEKTFDVLRKMKILIIGGTGMLGHKLVQTLSLDFDVWTTVRGESKTFDRFKIFDKAQIYESIDAENIEKIETIIDTIKPQVVINAVGIIKQLPESKDIVQTLTINSIFPHRLAEITKKYNARLITFSTDCVFSGKKGNYKEEDLADAADLYGKSKNLGEVVSDNCLTLRTSIIGRELFSAHSLVEWFLSNRGKRVRGYTNAVFSGFPTIIISEIIADLIVNHKNLEGLYHLSSEPINKFDLLNLLKKQYKIDIEIEPYENFYIDRSLDSTKFRAATGFQPIGWGKMLQTMADDKKLYRQL